MDIDVSIERLRYLKRFLTDDIYKMNLYLYKLGEIWIVLEQPYTDDSKDICFYYLISSGHLIMATSIYCHILGNKDLTTFYPSEDGVTLLISERIKNITYEYGKIIDLCRDIYIPGPSERISGNLHRSFLQKKVREEEDRVNGIIKENIQQSLVILDDFLRIKDISCLVMEYSQKLIY